MKEPTRNLSEEPSVPQSSDRVHPERCRYTNLLITNPATQMMTKKCVSYYKNYYIFG